MYHELMYHLDLCILAYQMHAQSLIWPFDPYYERLDLGGVNSRRANFMAEVRNHFVGNNNYHGPGNTQGWAVNNGLDPIMSRYDRLHPWLPAVTSPEPGQWLYYNTPPAEITAGLADVWMCHYNAGGLGPDGAAPYGLGRNMVQVQNNPLGAGNDHLYCFEGSTGRVNQTPSNFSLMGCIVDRALGGGPGAGPYEVHIAFRGSRSGAAGRAVRQGIGGGGNPDWATDMDFNQTVADPVFTSHGEVCRGFSRAVKACIPTALDCLAHIQARRGQPPDHIYVTGHSLGGALATHFTSAMLVGGVHGQFGAGLAGAHAALANWPWRRTRLITYSAPVSGNETFMHNFDAKVWCRRVVLSLDPITNERRHYHVGKEINISGENFVGPISYHEPMNVRHRLLRKLGQWQDNLGPPNAVPAQVAIAHPTFPWKVYNSFGALMAQQGATLTDANLRILFANLHADVQAHYLPILQVIIAMGSSYRSTIRTGTAQLRQQLLNQVAGQIGASAAVVGGGAAGMANAVGNRIANLRQEFDGDLGRFLGFVLMLSEHVANPALTYAALANNAQIQQCNI